MGLSLIFGVTRIVNFAHGSLYMLGAYLTYSLVELWGAGIVNYWAAVLLAALLVALFGGLLENLLLRHLYSAPELQQLIATFAVVLIVKDLALWLWGAEDLFGPRAAGLAGTITIGGRTIPQYDLFLIVLAPLVLLGLWFFLKRTRWGMLIRAATEDREMVAALGVNQRWLFCSVFMLGAFLAGLGGAVQLPREPANLHMDLNIIAEVFVVVVVGGMGSISGAFLASVLIGLSKALCIALGEVEWLGTTISFPRLTLVVEFIVMAIVLIFRPWGLLGKKIVHSEANTWLPLNPPGKKFYWFLALALLCLLALPWWGDRYAVVLVTDILIFTLFAASLHWLMGPGGMTSFGHAAYFGLGAYAAALLLKQGLAMEWAILAGALIAALGAVVYGWFCVRLAGVYLAMLTLAFAQITWSVIFQWDEVTGGSNGLVGVWPSAWLSDKDAYYWFVLLAVSGALMLLWRMIFSPLGYAIRAARDSTLRAEALGMSVNRLRWICFTSAGLLAGLAGALYAFSKGSISPEALAIPRSVDGLVMVMLGGLHTMLGPVIGAGLFTWLQDSLIRNTDYWRTVLGAVILLLVLVFPQGLAGIGHRFFSRPVR